MVEALLPLPEDDKILLYQAEQRKKLKLAPLYITAGLQQRLITEKDAEAKHDNPGYTL